LQLFIFVFKTVCKQACTNLMMDYLTVIPGGGFHNPNDNRCFAALHFLFSGLFASKLAQS
jgi:hypothetical protein